MKKIILIALIALFSSSCIKTENIKLHSVENITIHSSSRANLDFKLENNSAKKLSISQLNCTLTLNDKNFFKLVLQEPISIKRKSQETLSASLGYKFYNPLSLLSFMGGLNADKMVKGMKISGTIKLKAGIFSKKLTFEKLPLEELLRSLNIDSKELFNKLL